MPYDHHLKAGNEGDIVKHPALIAALDTTLSDQSNLRRPFHYLDLFAGYAWHPLLDGKEYEWKNGIGKLASTILSNNVPPAVKCWWDLWHLAPEWPTTTCAGYPGSSWIAAHLCRNSMRPIKLELYDHSEDARRDLARSFPHSHAIQAISSNICLIGQSLGLSEDTNEEIVRPDFVFIDPPGWSDRNVSNPKWEQILAHVLAPRCETAGERGKPTLLWMPSAGNDGAFQGRPNRKVAEAASLNYQWSAIRWRTDGAKTACVLVYNCASDAIRAAVDCVVQMAGNGWESKHSPNGTFEP